MDSWNKAGQQEMPDTEFMENWNRAGEPVADTSKSTLGAFGRGLLRTPENLIASGIMAVQGAEGPSVTDRGLGDRFVNWVDERNKALAKEYEGTGDFIPGIISKQEVAGMGQNIGFMGASMGGTVVGAVAAAPVPVPGARIAGGLAGGYAAGSRIQGYTAMNDWLNKKNEESIKLNKRPLTPEEETAFKSQYTEMAKESGFWEGAPEAAGNVAEIALLGGKRLLMKAPGPVGAAAKLIPDSVALKVAKAIVRLGAVFGVEELTETITQMGQHNVEVQAGMSNEPLREWSSPDDILKSAKEVLGPVLLLTGAMGAGGIAVNKLSRPNPVVEQLKTDPLDQEIGKLMSDLPQEMEAVKVPPIILPAIPPAPGLGVAPPVAPPLVPPVAPVAPPVAPTVPVAEAVPASLATRFNNLPVVEAPVPQITLSSEIPQHKRGANAKGIITPLEGKEYQRTPMKTIILWERNDGRLEVVTGRHRLDLAQRLGEKTIPSQIVREADGFTAEIGVALDAEQNILDNQGDEYDFANYFRTAITETDAKDRGLLRTPKARTAFILAKSATDSTFDAFRDDAIGFEQAAAIAKSAPQNETLQLAGRNHVVKNPRISPFELENYVKVLGTFPPAPQAEQGDMFGYDDTAIRTAEMQAKKVVSIVNKLKADSQTINAAIRREGKLKLTPEAAAEYGITDPNDMNQLTAARIKILNELDMWANWDQHPELVARLKGEEIAPIAPVAALPPVATPEVAPIVPPTPEAPVAPVEQPIAPITEGKGKQPWEMTRDEYFKQGETKTELLMDTSELVKLGGTNKEELNVRSTARYREMVDRMKRYGYEGNQIEPPKVVLRRTPDGGLKIEDGNHRVIAAFDAGVKKILVEIIENPFHRDIVSQTLSEGKYVQAVKDGTMTQKQVDNILKDYPDLKAPEVVPIAETKMLSRETAKLLLSLPAEQRAFPMGAHNAKFRQQIIKELTGQDVPQSKAGATAVRNALAEAAGIDRTKLAPVEVERRIQEWLERIVAPTVGGERIAPPAETVPATITKAVMEMRELLNRESVGGTAGPLARGANFIIKDGEVLFGNTQDFPFEIQKNIQNYERGIIREQLNKKYEHISYELADTGDKLSPENKQKIDWIITEAEAVPEAKAEPAPAPIVQPEPIVEADYAKQVADLQNKIDALEDRIDTANNADNPNDELIKRLEDQRDELQKQLDALGEVVLPEQKEATPEEVYKFQMEEKARKEKESYISKVESEEIPEIPPPIPEPFGLTAPEGGVGKEGVANREVTGELFGKAETPAASLFSDAIRTAIISTPSGMLSTYETQAAEDPSKNVTVPKGQRISLENLLMAEIQQNTGELGGQVTQVSGVNIGEGIFEIDRPYGKLIYNEATGEIGVSPAPTTSNMAAQSAKFGVDKTLLLQTLSKDIINNDLAGTIANETIQNSLDAFMQSQKGKSIDITIESEYGKMGGADETVVTVTDNGRGMTASEVKRNLLRLGAKGKPGTTTRGGYGLAKAGFILAPRRAEITTIKAGMKTVLKGTREQFFGVKGVGDPMIETTAVGTDFPNGTTFKLYFYANNADAEADNAYALPRWAARGAFDKYIEKGIFVDGVSINYLNGEYHNTQPTSYESKHPSKLPQVYKKADFNIKGNSLTVYFAQDPQPQNKDWSGKYKPRLITLNKGLALFGIEAQQYDIAGMWAQPTWRVIVDFNKTTDVQNINYPFIRNRTQMNNEISDAVSKVINDKIKSLNEADFDLQKSDFAEMVAKSPIINGIRVLIPFKDQTEFDKAAKLVSDNNTLVSDLAGIFNSFKAALAKIGGKEIDLTMTVDPKVHGYRSNPAVVGHEFYAINPFAITGALEVMPIFKELTGAGYDTNLAMASNLTHVFVHEYTHNAVGEHQENFTLELAKNYMKLTHGVLARLEQQARRFYEQHGKVLDSIQGDLSGMGKGGSRFQTDNINVYPARQYTGGITDRFGVQATGTGRAGGAVIPPPIKPPSTNQPASWDFPEPSRMSNFIYTFIDKQWDLRTVVKAIRTATGVIADTINPDQKQRLYSSIVSEKAKVYLETEFSPLMKEMMQNNVGIDEYEEYLWFRTARETNKYIASLGEDHLQDGGSGKKETEIKAYEASLDPKKKAIFDRLAKRTDKMLTINRDLIVDYQLESQDTVDKWARTYKNYAPLFREDIEAGVGTGEGFSVTGPASRHRKGSPRPVVDILAHIAEQRERIITRGEKNKIAIALHSLAKLYPNPDFWKIAVPRIVDRLDTTGQMVKVVDMSYIDKDNVVMARVLDPKTKKIVQKGVEFNTRNELAVRMAKSLKNTDMDTLGTILGTSAKITRFIASMNTQYNPIFGIVNFVRDFQFALLSLSTTPIAGKQREVMSHTIPALKAIYTDLRTRDKAVASKDPWVALWEDFRVHGGPTGYRDIFRTTKDRAEAIKREMIMMSPQTIPGKMYKTMNAMKGWLSDYNTAMENAVRLSVYKVAIDSGSSKDQSAVIAKSITVDFNRKGQIATQAGALYAFFNANAQGSARMLETLAGPAGKKIIFGGITLGAMQAMMMAAMDFDDEDPPEFVRERNLIIPIGGKSYVTIPMPLGFHLLPNIGRVSAEYAMGGFKSPMKKMGTLVSALVESFNPMGSSGISAQTITPTPLDPFIALAENRDWTGKQIARPNFSSLSPTPGFTRTKDTATIFSKKIAWALNRLSGGTEDSPGYFSPTPDEIDFLAGQFSGGVGREAIKAQQFGESIIGGEEIPTYKIPLTSRFYGSTEGQTNQASAFYNNLKLLNQHEREIKGRRDRREPITEYLKDNPEARHFAMANRAESSIARLMKQKRALTEREASQSSIKVIDAAITSHMRIFNETIKKAKG